MHQGPAQSNSMRQLDSAKKRQSDDCPLLRGRGYNESETHVEMIALPASESTSKTGLDATLLVKAVPLFVPTHTFPPSPHTHWCR